MSKFCKIPKFLALICALSASCNQNLALSYENIVKADNENLGDEKNDKYDVKIDDNKNLKFEGNSKNTGKECENFEGSLIKKDKQKNDLKAEPINNGGTDIDNAPSEGVKKTVEIVFVLDKSGSMDHLREATIKNFNQMLKNQRGLDEKFDVYVTTVLFSNDSRKVHDHQKINEVNDMTGEDYNPCGGTALLDTLGNTINEVSCNEEISKLDGDSNHKVIFVIMTDGEENSSKIFELEDIKNMIEDKRKLGWTFMFFGANIDSFAEAGGMGIDRRYVHNFTASEKGIEESMGDCSNEIKECLYD